MISYYYPDPTGKNPDYLKVNIPFHFRKVNVALAFESSPVFASTLRLVTTDGMGTPLVRDVDWTVYPSDIDETAMSRALLQNSGFNDTLIKSFTVISPTYVGQDIAASFQEYYLTTPGLTPDDGTPFEFSPAIAKFLIQGLADLKQQFAKATSPVVPYDRAPTLLPFDINEENPTNLIQNEPAAVNTSVGAKVIRLTQGAYFADSLQLFYNGQLLDKTTDYLPIGLSPLTKESTSKGGIYQFILITKNMAGQLTANYHAVGGEVQPDDADAIFELMISIKTFLNTGNFITAETLPQTKALQAVYSRVTLLEDNMRNLLSGAPTYGDTTGGTAVRRPISTTDAKFHWFTIAHLYQVQGSSDIITADQFRGRVYLPNAKIALNFIIDVNLNQTAQPVSFRTESLVFDPGYTFFGSTSVSAPVLPMVRLAWNNASQSLSGAILQIGLPLVNLTDQMVVEDLSSQQSCWLLDKTGIYVAGQTNSGSQPSDDGFTLPDGVTTWSSAGQSSLQQICVPQYNQGYLVYTGSNVTLQQTITTSDTTGLFNVVLPSYFPLDAVQSLVVTLQSSADTTVIYNVEVPLTVVQNGFKSGNATFVDAAGALVVAALKLTKKIDGTFSLALNTSDASSNELTLGNTAPNSPIIDTIRYIRAKV